MLTVRSVTARPVVLKLKRPVVARIATITEWPLVLIDLQTEEGIVGRSYLEPYVVKSLRYLVPALDDFAALLKGRRVAPVELRLAGKMKFELAMPGRDPKTSRIPMEIDAEAVLRREGSPAGDSPRGDGR